MRSVKKLVVKKAILFFSSEFSYCPLVGMCHHCIKNNKINCLHERFLRLKFSNKRYPFQKLLERDVSNNTNYKTALTF